MAKDLVPLRLEIAGMANRLFELVGFRPAEATEKQRQQLAAYAFGMAFALGQDHHLSPPEVHGLTISYLRDVFKYGDMQVVQFSDLLIQATASPSPQPKLKAIGHRGIDGYVLLKQKQIDRLREDLQDLLGLARIAQAPAVPAAPKPSFRAAREPDRDLIKHLVLGGDPVNFPVAGADHERRMRVHPQAQPAGVS
jgi:hypothetical protein